MASSALTLSQWLLDVSLLLTLQLAVVLVLRKTVRGYFGARLAYQLWMLPACWCLLSWFLHYFNSSGIAELMPLSVNLPQVSSILTDSIVATGSVTESVSPQTQSLTFASWLWPVLSIIWLSGFAVSITYPAFRAVRFHLWLAQQAGKSRDERHTELIARVGFPKTIQVIYLTGVVSPAIYGFLRQSLLLPENFDALFNPQQQQAILAHELTHCRRKDNLINLVGLSIRAVFWFNPAFYLAYRCFRLDQELSCDAIALRHASPRQRKNYAQALVNSAQGVSPTEFGLGICAWGTSRNLKLRIKSLNDLKGISNMTRYALLLSLVFTGSVASSVLAENDGGAVGSTVMLEAEVIPAEIFDVLSAANQASIEASEGTLPAIPADSEYIVFVIDTSGSMTNNPSWQTLLRRLTEILDLYPELKGMQVMNDMGAYLFSEPPREVEWIPDTPTNRNRIISGLRNWNAYSNSSPLEGIREAISAIAGDEEKISIYVMGDDLQPEASVSEIIAMVDAINREASNSPSERIHSIVFPTMLTLQQYQAGANNYVALMRSITQRNGGTFEILD